MTYIADLTPCTYIERIADPCLLAIGWLDALHPFPTGPCAAEVRDRLIALDGAARDRHWPPWTFGGLHTCEICGAFSSKDEIYVPGDGVVYMAPQMIHHYIEEHSYAPPRAFCDAVLAGGRASLAEHIAAARAIVPSLPELPAPVVKLPWKGPGYFAEWERRRKPSWWRRLFRR